MSGLAYQSGSLRIQRPTGIARPVYTPTQKKLIPNVGKHFPRFTNNTLTYRPTVELKAGALPDRAFGRFKKKRPLYTLARESVKDVQNFEFLRRNRVVDSGPGDAGYGPLPRDLFFRGGRRPDTAASLAYFQRLGREVQASELRPGYNRRVMQEANEPAVARQPPPPLIFGTPLRDIPVPDEPAVILEEQLPETNVELQTGENAFGGITDELPLQSGEDVAMQEDTVPIGVGSGTPAPNRSSLREMRTTGQGMKSAKPMKITRVGPSSLPFATAVVPSETDMAVPLYAEASGEGITDTAVETAFAGGSGSGGGADVNFDFERGEAHNPDVSRSFFQDPNAGHGQAFSTMPDPSPASDEINVVSADAVPLAHTDMPERMVQLISMAAEGATEAAMPDANVVRSMDGVPIGVAEGISVFQDSKITDVAENHITVELTSGQTVTALTGQSGIGVSTSDMRPELRDDVQQAQMEFDAAMENLDRAERIVPADAVTEDPARRLLSRADFRAAAANLARRLAERSLGRPPIRPEFSAEEIAKGIAKGKARYLISEGRRLEAEAIRRQEERSQLRKAQAKRKSSDFQKAEAEERAAQKRAGKKKVSDGERPPIKKRAKDDDDDDASAAPIARAGSTSIEELSGADDMRGLAQVVADHIKTVEPIQLGGANGPIAFRPHKELLSDESFNAVSGMLAFMGTAAAGSNKDVNRVAAGGNGIVVGPSGRPIAVVPQGDKIAAIGNNATGPVTVPRRKTVRERAIEAGYHLRTVHNDVWDTVAPPASGQLRGLLGERVARTAIKERTAAAFKARVENARKERVRGARATASLAPSA